MEIKLITGGLMGILLPSGKHEVKLEYNPSYYTTGKIISIIAVLIFATLII
ncbi:MAG: hypothetical protein GY936_09565 [Ignavibacteriae bacterium]|nr:hypothetical protein [Ignavibacteriota bacterium]